MNVLEKILEEIEEATSQEDAPIYLGDMEVDGYVRESKVKEIICSHMADVPDADNDWIPCDERLPEDGTYLCTLDGELIGEQEPFTGMCGIENGKWDEEGCVIAWKPLPKPYKQN